MHIKCVPARSKVAKCLPDEAMNFSERNGPKKDPDIYSDIGFCLEYAFPWVIHASMARSYDRQAYRLFKMTNKKGQQSILYKMPLLSLKDRL